jgi:hypothetical protein
VPVSAILVQLKDTDNNRKKTYENPIQNLG